MTLLQTMPSHVLGQHTIVQVFAILLTFVPRQLYSYELKPESTAYHLCLAIQYDLPWSERKLHIIWSLYTQIDCAALIPKNHLIWWFFSGRNNNKTNFFVMHFKRVHRVWHSAPAWGIFTLTY